MGGNIASQTRGGMAGAFIGFVFAALAVGAGAGLGPLAGGLIYDGLGRDYLFYFTGLS
ncbi:MAG: hypothetical protein JKX88_08925 [Marinicaulis sp.]|nr:hypothetical protein [Marinicaulis sp.]